MENFSFFPEQASTMASRVDAIYFVLIGLSVLFAVGIAIAIIVFGVRYRKSTQVDRSNPLHESMKLEFAWSFIPFLMAMGIFAWSAVVYYDINTPPDDAIEIYVVGKQWMWQIQHPLGKAELNELHVPINQPVKLIMSSQDVIHSFYVPAFRVKQDVLPGRYTTLWFEATKVGEYNLFCAEYCGTEHSKMRGKVVAMEPQDYQNWLGGGGGGESMVDAGARIFQDNGCASCHIDGEGGRGPSLHGIFGHEVLLEGGGTAVVDEIYLRESIYDPGAKVVAGYSPIMPSYEGSISEGGVLQLVAYIKSLSESQ